MRIVSSRYRRIIGIVAVVATVTVGCSSGDATAGPTTRRGASSTATAQTTTPAVDTLAPPTVVDGPTAEVDAVDNDFAAKHLQVSVGTKVTFTNAGRNQHDIVSDDPAAADFGVDQTTFQPGTTYDHTFTKPGTYAYYCSLHATATAGSMRGVITVTP